MRLFAALALFAACATTSEIAHTESRTQTATTELTFLNHSLLGILELNSTVEGAYSEERYLERAEITTLLLGQRGTQLVTY